MQKRPFSHRSFFAKLHPDLRDALQGQANLLTFGEKPKQQEDKKSAATDLILAVIPSVVQRVSDRDLIRINDMACEKARFYLDPVAMTLWEKHPQFLDQALGMPHSDLAAVIFFADPSAFDQAYSELHIDDYTFRMKRKGKNDSLPTVKPEFIESIRRRIELFYKESGKGKRQCYVEDLDDENRFAIMVYHQHRARYENDFDDETGELIVLPRKPVGMAMAVFQKHTHVLMVSARERVLRDELIGLMGEFYFGDRRHFDDPYAKEFDLSLLADPNLTFAFDAADGIGAVSVSEVTIQPVSADVGQMTFQCPHGLHSALRALGLSPDGLAFVGVKLTIHPDGHNWKRKRTIIIKLPAWLNLDDTPRDRLLTSYLERWGFFAKPDEGGLDDAEESLADVAELGELFCAEVSTRYRRSSPNVAH